MRYSLVDVAMEATWGQQLRGVAPCFRADGEGNAGERGGTQSSGRGTGCPGYGECHLVGAQEVLEGLLWVTVVLACTKHRMT